MNRSLGVLGLGSRSTLFYIKELNRLYHKKHGGYSTCPFKLLNANFDEINNLLPEASEQLDAIVSWYIEELIQLQINKILVPNITLHQTLERLNIETTIIHPIDSTIIEVQKMNCKKIFLFGSLYTMQSAYVKSKFTKNGIEVLIPSKKDRELIDELRKHIYYETETTDLIDAFNHLITKYTRNYCTVLACTELSIISNKNCDKLFDMSRIQLNAALNTI